MTTLLYKRSDWVNGNPPVAEFQSFDEAKREATRIEEQAAVEGTYQMSVACRVATNWVIAVRTR